MSDFSSIVEALRAAAQSDACDSQWDETKHPRGNPGNAGQFAKKGQQTSAGSASEAPSGEEGKTGGSSESRASAITPEEDAAYADAVKNGDKETAQRMVREAAAKAMPNTKVVDKDGLPNTEYHNGTFGGDKHIPEIGMEGMHFGSEKASKERKKAKIEAALRAKQSVTTFRSADGRWHYITDQFGPDEYNSYENGAPGWDTEEEARRVGKDSFEAVAENAFEEEFGYRTTACFLDIRNPYRCRDQGTYWGKEVRYAKEHGYDGIVYENLFEDRGSESYIAFSPKQIKSADPVTYDDDGNVIPLSRRFDNGDDIRGDVSKPKTSAQDSAINPKKLFYKALVSSLRRIGRAEKAVETEADRSRTYAQARARVDEREPSRDAVNAGGWMTPGEVRDMVKGNCSLIKTVPRGKKLKGVERRVKRLFENTNTTRDTLSRYLEGTCGLEDWQAERLINDQISKYNARSELERMKRQGVKYVRWVHGECHEPRPSHIAPWPRGLNGCVFPIDDPPMDPATGKHIYPGDEILCSCHLEAVE